jgi:hypothetical protein
MASPLPKLSWRTEPSQVTQLAGDSRGSPPLGPAELRG